jgi:hypothetical protein
VRENLRVLLVSGEPHAGERVWRNLLKSDAAVDLVHFTILRPPQKQDGTPIHQLSLIAFPTRELFSEKIKDFDLIIFDRYQHRDILAKIGDIGFGNLRTERPDSIVRGGLNAAHLCRTGLHNRVLLFSIVMCSFATRPRRSDDPRNAVFGCGRAQAKPCVSSGLI